MLAIAHLAYAGMAQPRRAKKGDLRGSRGGGKASARMNG